MARSTPSSASRDRNLAARYGLSPEEVADFKNIRAKNFTVSETLSVIRRSRVRAPAPTLIGDAR